MKKEITAVEFLTNLLIETEGYDAISRKTLKKYLEELKNSNHAT